ncbi:PadR family transcriptional regulator [Candidatus Leptofilum sp.]|uniref:PadR family transcriptional regulator n=1 Tax=Candidatus Leptofilum sp. TaxID=3241576 RepID=UPI003B5A373C
MTLKYAILGFLEFEPLSGYDLKTRYFDGSVGNFFPANQKQIYRTLERLEEEGWVVSNLEIQTGRPNRREYQITLAGQNALQNWLRQSYSLKPVQVPFLVQLYFMRNIAPEDVLSVLADQVRQHQMQLAYYHDVALPAVDDPTVDLEQKYGALTLDFGIRFERMQIEWLERAIETVSQSLLKE